MPQSRYLVFVLPHLKKPNKHKTQQQQNKQKPVYTFCIRNIKLSLAHQAVVSEGIWSNNIAAGYSLAFCSQDG